MIGIAVKTRQAAAPACEGYVFEQPRYEARLQSMPLIDEEE